MSNVISMETHYILNCANLYENALEAFDANDSDSVAAVEGTRFRLGLALVRLKHPEYSPESDNGQLIESELDEWSAD